ncbi:MAG: hypothetical protein ACI4B5_00025 [Bacteroidaceae bacterium]
MKKFIISAILSLVCLSSSAQSEFRERYGAHKGFLDVGLASAFADGENTVSFSLRTSHGIQINPFIFAGAGIGVGVTTGSLYDTSVMAPIFAHMRCNFTRSTISPYFDLKGGYSVGDFNGGYLQPSLGVSLPVTSKFAIDFGLAYTLNTHKESYSAWYYDYVEHIYMHTISLDFGFEF